jgi:multidrug efflux pump subunit AcrB
MSNLGHGNPQIFYNVRPEQEKANHASVFVGLKEWSSRTPKVLDQWRAAFAKIPGAQVIIVVFENGPPLEAPIAVRISGKEMATLKDLAGKASAIIEAVPGARDVVNPLQLDRIDLSLGLDADKAATLGVPAGAIDQTVRIALSGEIVGSYRQSNGDEFDITLRLPFGGRHELGDLDRIYVPVGSGPGIPLSHISTPRLQSEPARIDRFKRERTVTITGRTASGFLTSRVTQEVFERLKSIPLPPGYRISAGGQAEAQARSFGGLGSAVLLALFGIMAVIILEFRSFKTSGVVAGVIPLGIIGGLIGLWVTGYPLAFTAVIGFIALIGIEIKNSILLVDFTQQLRAVGVPLREAIEQAGEIRFLPVLLTSATAIGGLMPLAIEGSGLYSPLAIVIIGGLISSTVLSRLVTPVMYLLLAPEDEPAEKSAAAA